MHNQAQQLRPPFNFLLFSSTFHQMQKGHSSTDPFLDAVLVMMISEAKAATKLNIWRPFCIVLVLIHCSKPSTQNEGMVF
jgi:hypothetical protein